MNKINLITSNLITDLRNLSSESSMNEKLYEWTKGICDYRLHYYFEKKVEKFS